VKPKTWLRRFASVACFGLLVLLLGFAKPSAAQNVVGVSEILSSTNSSEIDTYSATEIDYQTSLYYGAYVEGYLYQNGTLIAAGSASHPSNAYGYMSKPLQVPDQYQLESDHYLVAQYVYAYAGGTTYWSNPNYYLIASDGSTDPSGSSFSPGGGPAYYSSQYFYLGTTAVSMSSAGPTITSISPSSAVVGASGTITVYGSNLVDVFTNQASASITGSGISLSIGSASASQVTVNYSIATNASTGNQNLTLSTRFGTSNAAAFNVGDPTPVVVSISPSVWSAGTVTRITISGRSFGSNPSLTVTGPRVSGSSIVSASDTQIVANVTIAANSPGGTATVQVQSNGYGGNGFVAVSPGQSAQGSNTASIQPLPAPVPQILFNGKNVSGTNQSVVVGRQIALTVAPPGNGLSVNTRSWSGVNVGAAIGGWTPGKTPDSPTPNNENFTFYWVDAGSSGTATYTVSYTWTLDNGQSNSASVSFTVAGPVPTGANGTFFSATPGTLNVWPADKAFGGGVVSTPALELGNNLPDNPGMSFNVKATPPNNAGMFQWVQLIGTITERYLAAPPISNILTGPALDNWYPFVIPPGSPDYTSDSPGIQLWANNITAMGEASISFTATMYLMWDPALPGPGQSSCAPAVTTKSAQTGQITTTASTCRGSIPVPLAYVNWGFSGDAINTLQTQSSTNTTWLVHCGGPQPAAPTAQSTRSYPQWTTTMKNRTTK
jgi:hypothetical protein